MEKRKVMTVTTIDLFEILKGRIGESDAKTLVVYIEMQVKDNIDEKMTSFATKADLHEEVHKLELKMVKIHADLIKWMFIFWAGQTGLIITMFKLFLK